MPIGAQTLLIGKITLILDNCATALKLWRLIMI